MAHPDGIGRAPFPYAIEQRRGFGDLDLGAAELAVMTRGDFAAELDRHQLLAVTDAEDGNAGLEDRLRRAGRSVLQNRRRAAGEDHRLGLEGREHGLCRLERHDFAIDSGLAHPAGDKLGDLRPKIDDEHFVVVVEDVFVEIGGGHS